MADKRDIAVIGLGTFGAAIAKELSRMGDRVIGVDLDPDIVAAMDDHLEAVVQANATDAKSLQKIGLESCDIIILAIGDDMQASLLTAMQIREMGCGTLFIKAQTPEHGQILNAMGFTNLLEPEQSFALHMAQKLQNPRIVDFMGLRNDHYIAAFRAPSGSECKTLSDMDIRKFNLTCLAIDVGERVLTDALSDHELGPHDMLILAGTREDFRRFSLNG